MATRKHIEPMEPVPKENLESLAGEAKMFLLCSNAKLFTYLPIVLPTFLIHRFGIRWLDDDTLYPAFVDTYLDTKEEREKTGRITPTRHVVLFSYLSEVERRREKATSRKIQRLKIDRLYQLVELVSFLLPRQARVETFEPYYHDLKGDFVRARQRYKGKWARRWLTFCFLIHSTLTLGNCFWVLLGEKGRRTILRLLPDVVRRFWGG